MPRRVTDAEVEMVWHTYESFHGVPKITREEAAKGVRKLLRMIGLPVHQHPEIKFVTGRNRTAWMGTRKLNINLTKNTLDDTGNTWRDIVRACAWRKTSTYDPGLQIKMARRVCMDNWLLGELKPEVKPKVKLTKDQVRAGKIARLEVRLDSWQRKQDRAITAMRKINRSLNALRRFSNE